MIDGISFIMGLISGLLAVPVWRWYVNFFRCLVGDTRGKF